MEAILGERDAGGEGGCNLSEATTRIQHQLYKLSYYVLGISRQS